MTIKWNDLAWNDLIEVTRYQPKSTVRILRCIEYSWRFKQFAKVVAYPVKQIKPLNKSTHWTSFSFQFSNTETRMQTDSDY